MAYDGTKPNRSQTIGDVIDSANANDAALKAQQDAHQADSSAAHGLAAVLAAIADYNTHKANSADAHGLAPVLANVSALLAEVSAGRGTQSTLAARLGIALQADGAIKLSSLANKWLDNGDTPTYLTTTTFSVPTDRTKVYIAGAHLRCTISGSYAYAPIASSVFASGATTITLDPNYPILTAGLSKIEIGLLSFDYAIQAGVTANAAAIVSLTAQLAALQVPNKRNFLINGSCEVAQRTAPNLSTAAQYGAVDRWAAWGAGTAVSAGTIAQDTAATIASTKGTALHLSGVTITGAGVVYARQRIEAANAKPLKNQTASFSAIVRHDVGSAISYTITVRKANSADNFAGVTQIAASSAISVASGADTVITLAGVALGDCSAGLEIEISVASGAVTTKNFRFTDLKAEIGVISTAFVARDLAHELNDCRRYYREVGGRHAYESVGVGMTLTTTTAQIEFDYSPMRVAPTITVSSAAHFGVFAANGSLVAASAVAANNITAESALLAITVASGLTAGSGTVMQANNTTPARLYLNAEL